MELRAIREERGLTADQLAKRIHYSRMQVSRLENGLVRPDIAELFKVLDVLGVFGERREKIIRIACQGAERGWWDKYGDAMGSRQRLYANIEFGAATVREYIQTGMPGVFQTPEFMEALIKLTEAEGPLDFKPEKMMEGRLKRQEVILRENGPDYEVILDELVMRRITVPLEIMAAQLQHLGSLVSRHPNISVRILPVDVHINGALLPQSNFIMYTFPDPDDPPMVVDSTVANDNIHTSERQIQRYTRRYEHLSRVSLSPKDSASVLAEAADRITAIRQDVP